MKRFLLSAMLLLALGSAAAIATEATPPVTPPSTAPAPPTITEQTITVEPPTPTEFVTDRGYGVRYTKERVVHLPQDGNKFFVTVFGNPNDPKFNEIKGWFVNVPELAKLKAETNFNAISTTSVDYRDKYAKHVATTPTIRVQTAAGGVVYQVSGASIPMSGQALSKAVNTEFLRRWRERRLDRINNNGNGNNRQADVDADGDDEEEEVDSDKGDHNKFPDTQPAPYELMSDETTVAVCILGAGLLGVLVIGGFAAFNAIQSHASRR